MAFSLARRVRKSTIPRSGAVRRSAILRRGGVLQGETGFRGATFHSEARFGGANFYGETGFVWAKFNHMAVFEGANFHGAVGFGGARFNSSASFDRARFARGTWFGNAQFDGQACFSEAQFEDAVGFDGSQFRGGAKFAQTYFKGNVGFNSAHFLGETDFRLVTFPMFATFTSAHFAGPANFNAIRGERAFDLANARFERVPDFIQAHFEEAPRLDHVAVVGRMIEPKGSRDSSEDELLPENLSRLKRVAWRCKSAGRVGWHYCKHGYPRRWASGARKRVLHADESIPARWRALKRLAIQGHDGDREHEFFAREIRSARFATDWPLPLGQPSFSTRGLKWLNYLPLIFWRPRLWAGFFRFWFGTLYGLFSNYGRSVAIPFTWWIAAIGLGAMAYLSEHRGWAGDANATRYEDVFAPVRPMVRFYDDWRVDRPCFTPPYQGPGNFAISGLSDQLRAKTSAPNEALHLAFRNAFLVLDGGEEAAHRIYGCLYGLELYNQGDPVPIVPPGVSIASAAQKIFSAVMIFLFGLALRNMLKMK
jgi:hypothetical protein